MNVENAFTEVLTQIYRVVSKKALDIGDDPAAPSTLVAKMMSLLSRSLGAVHPKFVMTMKRSVKVLPVSRGDGIYQKGMDMALSKLNNGGWVHIFPEGSRSKDGGKTIAPAKRGVGRLVMDADSLPVVIPFVHTGMQDIMPVGKRIPRAGKRVIVVVGDPINFDDLIIDNRDDTQHISRAEPSDFQGPPKQAKLELHLEPEQAKPELLLEQGVAQSAVICSDAGVPHWFRHHMNPSELMGFAARGLLKNGRAMEEGYREFQVSDNRLQRTCFGDLKVFQDGALLH
ncbi:hypothetical protein GUJ93_ZPchr0001g30981 [Zizania palustris]|uniref:Tafazzin family protein n=1 Tax=Zizania palustris TaxID=103762 RepID=A0A8J5V1R5_ZIZPA|nr:hypothetical protein GUJ93_ZPchr0001g30981 [Zizania palustris]